MVFLCSVGCELLIKRAGKAQLISLFLKRA